MSLYQDRRCFGVAPVLLANLSQVFAHLPKISERAVRGHTQGRAVEINRAPALGELTDLVLGGVHAGSLRVAHPRQASRHRLC